MASMLVIGLGRFGNPLAIKLMELGNEVLAIDKDPEAINRITPFVTRAQIGDCMDEGALAEVGVTNFEVCFVCISDSFQSSMEITSNLKELGAKKVVSKTDRDIHAKFLLKIGADAVVYPERDMAQRTAMRYSAKGAFDYIELTPEYALFEIEVPKSWIGKNLIQLNIRSKYSVNVIGRKKGNTVTPVIDAEKTFDHGEHLIIAGNKGDLLKMINHV